MDLSYLWFWLIAFFFVGYFVLDGFDFGVGMTLPFLGRDDISRRQVINTIGPIWDLNETWLIVAGACLFASFPEWYASLFSGFYLPLLIILLALILRGVSFEYRHQREDAAWRARFDRMIVIGSVVPAFLWGVAFGNIVQGVALNADHVHVGGVFALLNPYALLVGVTTLMLFFLHGVYFVALKTDGRVQADARRLAKLAAGPTLLAAAATVIWTALLASGRDAPGLWAVIAAGVVAAVALLVSVVLSVRERDGRAFAGGVVAVLFAVVMLFAALFPYVLPSTIAEANSLTIENASSTPYTLQIMSWTALVALPLVIAYQSWTYWVFRKRVTRRSIEAAPAHA
ncbi:cytochrome d ubiquinol oxidase subunit II [Microbacterium sp.]|uniref:cytochrome d ubiquinol oxidase subunit II n=1 Tax=Microbacterium sp. TaxID=51671 RepID=UPI0028128D9B|nr:cytochrome d ubiquinol oxidase subunit II [Microbacterium sp.]